MCTPIPYRCVFVLNRSGVHRHKKNWLFEKKKKRIILWAPMYVHYIERLFRSIYPTFGVIMYGKWGRAVKPANGGIILKCSFCVKPRAVFETLTTINENYCTATTTVPFFIFFYFIGDKNAIRTKNDSRIGQSISKPGRFAAVSDVNSTGQ